MPGQCYNLGGYRTTGEYRLKNTWYGTSVVEEKREYIDGSIKWKKLPWYESIELNRVADRRIK